MVINAPDGHYWTVRDASNTTHSFDMIFMTKTASSPAKTLKPLTITCWGFYMRNIFRNPVEHDIFFTILVALGLCGSAFTTDWAQAWILQHGETFRSLTLDGCAIMHSLELRTKHSRDPVRSVQVIKEGSRRL